MTTAPMSPTAGAIVDALALRMLDAASPAPLSLPEPTAGPAPQPLARPSPLDSALQAAASRQGGLGSLLADLMVAMQAPDLPAPVAMAAAKVLALQQPAATAPGADDLKQALAQSGLMLEARLAADGAPPDEDLKAALLILRQTLETAPAAARTDPAAPQPAPPYRGGPVQAQPAMASSLPADAATDAILQRLLQGVEAALARQTLMQLASVPGAAGSPAAQTPQWLFEIPFMVPPGAAIAQLEIGRDEDEHGSAASDEAEPTWRARFSLDLDPMGPVHARISLRGGRVRVTLWAERGATAAQLDAQRDALAQALLGDDLVASVAVFPGAPDTPRPAAGKFMDRAL
jgi:Flagellar hook-length control protein FliK